MEQKWQVGPIEPGGHTMHLAKGGNVADCKPFTQEDLVWTHATVYAPGFGNALTARLLDARVEPDQLCAECFPGGFRTNYAQVCKRQAART